MGFKDDYIQGFQCFEILLRSGASPASQTEVRWAKPRGKARGPQDSVFRAKQSQLTPSQHASHSKTSDKVFLFLFLVLAAAYT